PIITSVFVCRDAPNSTLFPYTTLFRSGLKQQSREQINNSLAPLMVLPFHITVTFKSICKIALDSDKFNFIISFIQHFKKPLSFRIIHKKVRIKFGNPMPAILSFGIAIHQIQKKVIKIILLMIQVKCYIAFSQLKVVGTGILVQEPYVLFWF